MIHTDGSIGVSCPSSVAGNNYYLKINHRNTVETWSALPVRLDSTIVYDFTSGASQSYGENMADLGDGNWGFYTGDMNQDQSIDIFDFSKYDYDVSQFAFGYYDTDLNGDGSVDIFDFPVFDQNCAGFIFSMHP